MTIGPFWSGDAPATPIELDLYSDEDMSAYTTATINITRPDGTALDPIGPVTISDSSTVTFAMPALSTAGIYTITPVLVGGAHHVTASPVSFVVQLDDGWHTLDSAREAWASAPTEDAQLERLLLVAKIQCTAYAPAFTGRPPVNYVQAQLMQARGVWQSVRSSGQDALGSNDFTVTVFPMDWTVKALLRPKRGIPVVA